jgi:hypothetical protein
VVAVAIVNTEEEQVTFEQKMEKSFRTNGTNCGNNILPPTGKKYT